MPARSPVCMLACLHAFLHAPAMPALSSLDMFVVRARICHCERPTSAACVDARSLARSLACMFACLLACLCLQWQDSRPLIRFITGKDLPLRATSIGSGRTMAVKILEPYPTDRTLPPARPHCELRPSNIIIGALGCTWKPQSSRLRLSENYYFDDTF